MFYSINLFLAPFSRQLTHYTSVKSVDFIIDDADELFGTELGVGDVNSIKKKMTMPLGTLTDFTYFAGMLIFVQIEDKHKISIK